MSLIDSIDQTIIRLLMEDGRMSIPDISRRIPDTTERLIRYRLDRLLKKDMIRLSTVVIPATVGFSVTAEVLLQVETGAIQSVAEKLTSMEAVSYVCITLGNHDIGITIHARNIVELYTMVSDNIASLPGVKEIITELVPLQLKDIYHWQIPDSVVSGLVPPRKPPFFPQQIIAQEINSFDRAIVDCLMEDARMSAASIARHLGSVSLRTVNDHIDLLVQKNLIRITAVVNPERVGFPVKADIYVQVESMHLLETAHRLAELELTSWVACAIRDSHFSIQVCVQDVRELYRFVSEVIHKVPGITRTATSLVSQVLKDSYDWHIPKSKAEDVPIKGRELA